MPAATPSYGIDPTDIPCVPRQSMRDALCVLVFASIAIDPPRALSDAQHAAFVEAFWRRHDGTGPDGLALQYRLTAMLRAISARQLEPLFVSAPERVLTAAADVAATQRLNPLWGFNRMRFVADVCWRLRELEIATPVNVRTASPARDWRRAA